MDAPTTEDIREWSHAEFDALEYPEPTGDDEDTLQLLLDRSIEYVLSVTGRTMDSIPTDLENTAEEAIQRRVEQLVIKAQPEEVETAGDFDMIDSFTAGSYTENRRGLDEWIKSKMINPWPLLHDLLWRLATDDKRDEWLEWWGQIRPAFAVTEVDWHGTLLPPPITQGMR